MRATQAGDHRYRPEPELEARGSSAGLAAPRGSRPPAPGRLGAEHEQPEQDEHEREGAAGRRREPDLDLRVDLGRERLEAEDLERPELGEEDQRHEQRAAEERGADLVQRHPRERPDPAEAQAARDVLEARVGSPERGGDGQIDERVAAERHHEHRAPVAGHAGRDRDPAVAEHEVRHRERQHEHDRPEPPPREVRTLDAPRRRYPEHGADQRDGEREAHGVPEQLEGEVPEEQRPERRPADLRGLEQQEHEREQHRACDHASDPEQARRCSAPCRR